MPYGYKLQFGVQRVTEPDPNRQQHKGGRFAMTVIIGFACIIVALLILRPSTGGATPAAQIQPAASASFTPTPTATPKPSPSTVRLTCTMPKSR